MSHPDPIPPREETRGSAPFSRDALQNQGYLYTTNAPASSIRANDRISAMIHAAADFQGRAVVDVGCGDGTYTRRIQAETGAASVLGLEPAAEAVDIARQRYDGVPGLRFDAAYSSELAQAGRRFDIAVYRGVIHHVEDPAAEIATGLRLGGTVIFLEPNGLNPVLKVIEKCSAYHRAHGERSYTRGAFLRWIRAGGGEVVSVRFFGLVPFFCPDWFVRIGTLLEPLVERIPLLRRFVCGQILIVARGAPAPGGAPR